METTTPRFNPFSLIAPGLVSVSLLASALILAHRPPAVSPTPAIPRAASEAVAAPVLSAPPITQASAAAQFRTQALAAPTLHTILYKGQTYTLADVKVTQVTYTAKDDYFRLNYDWVWQPVMPAGGPQSDSSPMTNDGYGHYYGPAVLSPIVGGSGQNADITIK